MRVFISVDLEGATGTTDVQEMQHGRDSYEHARRWMTGDANAAVEGALAGGASEVVVCDSHNQGRNLLVDELHPDALLVRGRLKPRRMLEGLDPSFGAAFFVGYHGRAGAHPGVLNHTWVGKELMDVRVNGTPAGELRLNATLAGELGVPVTLVTGDDVACEEAAELLPGVRTVAVKRALDRFSAAVRHPERTGAEIRAAAEAAVRGAADVAPLPVAGPYELEVDWSSTSMARACAAVPRVEQVGPVTNRFSAEHFAEVLDAFIVLTTLAVAVGQQPPYS
jgi:D-amino peptidase